MRPSGREDHTLFGLQSTSSRESRTVVIAIYVRKALVAPAPRITGAFSGARSAHRAVAAAQLPKWTRSGATSSHARLWSRRMRARSVERNDALSAGAINAAVS